MAVGLEVAVPDLLPAVRAPLVHPRLRRVRQPPARAHPVQVLALVGPLVARAVVEARVGGREAVGPVLRVGGEVGVPDEVGPGDGAGDGVGGFAGWEVVGQFGCFSRGGGGMDGNCLGCGFGGRWIGLG